MFGLIVLGGLLFGYHVQTTPPPVTRAPWFDFGFQTRKGVIVFLALAAIAVAVIVEGARYIFDDSVVGTVMISVFSVVILGVLSSKRRILYSTRPIVTSLKEKYSVPVFLLTRLGLEFLVLATIHANLPVVFSGIVSTTYKNGIGFAIGIVLSFVVGRDGIWIWRNLPLTALAVTASIVGYVVIVLICPALYASNALSHHPSISIVTASAISVQLVAAGSVWSVASLKQS